MTSVTLRCVSALKQGAGVDGAIDASNDPRIESLSALKRTGILECFFLGDLIQKTVGSLGEQCSDENKQAV